MNFKNYFISKVRFFSSLPKTPEQIMMGKKNFVRYCSHNQKDPGLIYDLQSSFTNMIYETKITKKALILLKCGLPLLCV